ncbi:LysR family transcriptional regulator [Nocardia sp. NPDC051030]|uniref:LysR family transcriptional regulator n=1 Tax=Nocardia sp. NPDC051030 TaxID=3155162 RepID=UPI003439B0AB
MRATSARGSMPDVELRQLRYVLMIAEAGSFSAAAEQALIAQSALSQQVGRLERELGTKLFERSSRGVTLTAAGRAFAPLAEETLRSAEQASLVAASHGQLVGGRLAVGAYPNRSSPVPAIWVSEFHTRYPSVEVSLREGLTDELIRLVERGELDVAVVGLSSGLELAELDHLVLVEDPVGLVLPAQHAFADAESLTLDQLTDEAFIDGTPGAGMRILVDHAFQQAGIVRRVQFEVSNPLHSIQLVHQGLGVAFLPRRMIDPESLSQNGVRWISVDGIPSFRESLVFRRGRLSAAAREFIGMVRRDNNLPANNTGEPATESTVHQKI